MAINGANYHSICEKCGKVEAGSQLSADVNFAKTKAKELDQEMKQCKEASKIDKERIWKTIDDFKEETVKQFGRMVIMRVFLFVLGLIVLGMAAIFTQQSFTQADIATVKTEIKHTQKQAVKTQEMIRDIQRKLP